MPTSPDIAAPVEIVRHDEKSRSEGEVRTWNITALAMLTTPVDIESRGSMGTLESRYVDISSGKGECADDDGSILLSSVELPKVSVTAELSADHTGP